MGYRKNESRDDYKNSQKGRRSNNNRGNRNGRREKDSPEHGTDLDPPKDTGIPEEDIASQVPMFLLRKSFRDLSWHNNVQVKADPHTEISYTSDPYAIYNVNNPVVDARYSDDVNENGNIATQLARASNSTLQNVIDYFLVNLKMNYNYQKITESSNASKAVNEQVTATWQEVQAKLQSESFYSLPFFDWKVTGDTQFSDSILDIVNFYQIFAQAIESVAAQYKKVMAHEQHLKNMTFYLGSPIVERVYGLLKKKGLIGAINASAKAMGSNFLDYKWLEQVGVVFLNTSRRFNGMLAPLNEAVITYDWNDSLTVSLADVELFKTSEFTPFFEAVEYVMRELNIGRILQFARDAEPGNFDINNDWFNPLVKKIDSLISYVNKFNKYFNDMSTAWHTLQRLGLTEWQIGRFTRIEDIDGMFEPSYNILLEDVIQAIFSGSSTMVYNKNLYKYVLYDVLDIYTGIPRYMASAGGAFLTCSTKKVNIDDAPPNVLYPVMFDYVESKCITRNGTVIPVTRSEVETKAVELARISALSSIDDVKIWVPVINLDSFPTQKEKSWALRFLAGLVGYYSATTGAGAAQVSYYGIDPDKVCLVDIEQEDITNTMLDYIRQTSPFRVVKATAERKIGFLNQPRKKQGK